MMIYSTTAKGSLTNSPLPYTRLRSWICRIHLSYQDLFVDLARFEANAWLLVGAVHHDLQLRVLSLLLSHIFFVHVHELQPLEMASAVIEAVEDITHVLLLVERQMPRRTLRVAN